MGEPLAAALVEFRQVLSIHRVAGGFGVGYGAPAALGAALANKKHGRLTVTIQNDGDLMYAPGVLWTSAHHRIPLLSVMHNNRAYHQEVMHVQRMCRPAQPRRGSRVDRHDAHGSQHRFRHGCQGHGRLFRGTDHRSQGPGARDPARRKKWSSAASLRWSKPSRNPANLFLNCGGSPFNDLFCHSERSEESLFDLGIRKKQREILRFAQNDGVLNFSAARRAIID